MSKPIMVPNWRGELVPACAICKDDLHGYDRPATDAADCYIGLRQELLVELKRLRSWGRALSCSDEPTFANPNRRADWNHSNLILHRRDAAREVFVAQFTGGHDD